MAKSILMPQVGQDLTEGRVVAMNVKVGDNVKKGDMVAEVESEKATFEVEAFEELLILAPLHDNALAAESRIKFFVARPEGAPDFLA